MQAMAALAEEASAAAALSYSQPGMLAQAGPLAPLLGGDWLQNVPDIQQLLSQLPPPDFSSPG